MRVSGVTKYSFAGLPTLLFSPRMQGNHPVLPARGGGRSFAGTVLACGGAGALLGWAAGERATALWPAMMGNPRRGLRRLPQIQGLLLETS